MILGLHVGYFFNVRSDSPRLKSLARDSMYSRLASRFASTADTKSSTETWSLAASSAARLYKSSGTAMLFMSPLPPLSSKTHAVSLLEFLTSQGSGARRSKALRLAQADAGLRRMLRAETQGPR